MNAADARALRLRLGRAPRRLEEEIVEALWSEHAAYRHSRAALALRLAPPRPPAFRGAHAGGVVLPDGTVVGVKIESHNHPSAIEPKEGAATGVGGVLRDLLATRLVPVALADALAFGPLTRPAERRRARRIVEGIAWYANTFGVPTIAGETRAGAAYAERPLVNVAAVGVGRLHHAPKPRAGDALLLVGKPTDATGLGGAAFASRAHGRAEGFGRRAEGFGRRAEGSGRRAEGSGRRAEGSGRETARGAIQVADPLMGWRLGRALPGVFDLVSEIADLGAAGLAGAAYEVARASGMGVRLTLDRVHTRTDDLSPRETLLAETQERMLFAVRPNRLSEVRRRLTRWDVPSALVGKVAGEALVVHARGRALVDLPLSALAAPPPRDRPARWRPSREQDVAKTDPAWVYAQYDWGVGGGTLVEPGAGPAGVVRTAQGPTLALAVKSRPDLAARDPACAARAAVEEAVAAVVAVGGRPILLADGLNVGDPEHDPAMAAIEASFSGLAEASRKVGLPVVSGNVSCYNAPPDVPPTLYAVCVGIVS